MELKGNQMVLFDDGHKAGITEAFWSNKHQAFCYVSDDLDDEGNRIIHYSTTIIEKPQRKHGKFVPNEKNCTVKIRPLAETEKAYQIEDGTNGLIGKHTCREYYKWIAKSVCFVDGNGHVFAPEWATR